MKRRPARSLPRLRLLASFALAASLCLGPGIALAQSQSSRPKDGKTAAKDRKRGVAAPARRGENAIEGEHSEQIAEKVAPGDFENMPWSLWAPVGISMGFYGDPGGGTFLIGGEASLALLAGANWFGVLGDARWGFDGRAQYGLGVEAGYLFFGADLSWILQEQGAFSNEGVRLRGCLSFIGAHLCAGATWYDDPALSGSELTLLLKFPYPIEEL